MLTPPPPPPPPAIVRPYDPPQQRWAAGHRGMDLAAAAGSPVRALAPGRVGTAGPVAGKPVVTVMLADGRRVTYEPVTASVAPGQVVARGEVIGRVASAGGHCGGAAGCLHVGLRAGRDYLDPAPLLGRAVLRPTRLRDPAAHADGAG